MSSTHDPRRGSIAKGRFVDPGCARVDEVVFDAERTGGAMPAHDVGGDAYESGMTNETDNFVFCAYTSDTILVTAG